MFGNRIRAGLKQVSRPAVWTAVLSRIKELSREKSVVKMLLRKQDVSGLYKEQGKKFVAEVCNSRCERDLLVRMLT